MSSVAERFKVVPLTPEEWHSWDVYLAGALKAGLQWSAAVEAAEQCLRDRRERAEFARGVKPTEETLKVVVRQLRGWAREALDQPNAQRDQPGLGERSRALHAAAEEFEKRGVR